MADLTYLPPMTREMRSRLLRTQVNTPADSPARMATIIDGVGDSKLVCRLGTAAALAAYTRARNTIVANANGAMADVDSVAPAVGDRIFLKNGASNVDNGPWVIKSLGSASTKWSMERAEDWDETYKVVPNSVIKVSEGSTLADSHWQLTTNAPIVLNTTALVFAETSGARFATYAALAAVTNALGASLVGVQDAALILTGTTVEAALAEIAKWSRMGSGAANPLVTYDSDNGYARGARYLNTATTEVFINLDPSVGTAVWRTEVPIRKRTALPPAGDRITNTLAETAFATTGATIPANCPVGTRFVGSVFVEIAAAEAAEDCVITLKAGAGGTIAASALANRAVGTEISIDFDLVVTATGAGGKVCGVTSVWINSTPTTSKIFDMALDLSAARVLTVYSDNATASAGNQVDLMVFNSEIYTA